jgi:predicted transposase YbfD/YdcC
MFMHKESGMDASVSLRIPRAFADLPDPRKANHMHRLVDIVTIALLAVISGAEDWVNVALWGQCKHQWLASFLELPAGIPSHDTFNRVFSRIDPDAFENCFRLWTTGLVEASGGKLVAIDGKSLRRSFEHGWDKSGMCHLVSAFVQANHLVLAQRAADGKGKELDAMAALLKLLDLKGSLVTIDAIACQKNIAQLITDAKADYLLQVKENQSTLLAKTQTLFAEAELEKYAGFAHATAKSVDGEHGRIETRVVDVLWDIQHLGELAGEWPALASLVRIRRTRETIGKDGQPRTTTVDHYAISSLGRQHQAQRFLDASRGHWCIENNLHWQLDVSFGEDDCRLHKDHGAENFSRLCRIALNLLKRETSRKVGIKTKRNICGWDHDYLLKVLLG